VRAEYPNQLDYSGFWLLVLPQERGCVPSGWSAVANVGGQNRTPTPQTARPNPLIRMSQIHRPPAAALRPEPPDHCIRAVSAPFGSLSKSGIFSLLCFPSLFPFAFHVPCLLWFSSFPSIVPVPVLSYVVFQSALVGFLTRFHIMWGVCAPDFCSTKQKIYSNTGSLH
jgi:hypothetical protein